MTENFDEVKEEWIKKGYEVNVQNKNITIERENKKSILKTLNKEWNNEYILGYREKTKEAQKSFVENLKKLDRGQRKKSKFEAKFRIRRRVNRKDNKSKKDRNRKRNI